MLFSDKVMRVQLFDSEDSLNPCCNGCCSLTGPTSVEVQRTRCLNPCCNGCCSLTQEEKLYDFVRTVLILVVMDAVL